MLKQMPTWKKAVFGILAIALVLAAFLFSKVKADGGELPAHMMRTLLATGR